MRYMDLLDFQTSDLVRDHKYLELQGVSELVITNSLERYDVIRASIITGNYLRAKFLLNQEPFPADELGVFVNRFLSTQLTLYEAKQFKDSELKLLSLNKPNTPFLRAELNFVTGYNYLGMDDYRKASAYFIKAARDYSEIGFPLHEANCLYNLSICHHTLNEKTELNRRFKQLEDLSDQHGPHPTLQHLVLRFKAYVAVDQEDFSSAIECFNPLVQIYKSTQRLRDLGDAYCSLAFCFLILNRLEEFDLLLEQIKKDGLALDLSNSVALEAFKKVRFINFWKRNDVEKMIEFWCQSEIHSVYLINLIQVLLETLNRHGSYSTMLSIARKTLRICEEKHQIRSLSDVEYYQITALVHLGKRHLAAIALTQFKLAAKISGHNRRLEKSECLERLFSQNQLVKLEERVPIKILMSEIAVSVGEEVFVLKSKPMLFRAILELAAHPEEVTLEKFFKKLYGVEFSTERHSSRMNSVLNRLKEILGKDAIERNSKGLSLSEKYYFVPGYTGSERVNVVLRRKAIRDFIKEASSPVSISEMESALEYNRRTLQLDLKEMVEGGLLSFEGMRKSRKYFAREGERYVS